MADGHSVASKSTYMSQEEQNERRKKIRDIMQDGSLTQQEKSKQIQHLMDGRRRSSATGSVTWSVTSSCCPDNDELFWQQSHQQQQPPPPQNQQQQYVHFQHQQQHHHPQQRRLSAHSTGHYSFSSLVARGGGGANDDGVGDADDGDDMMMDADGAAPDDIYSYNHYDYRSVASSISDGSEHNLEDHGNAFLLPPGTYRQMHGRSLSLQDWNEEDRQAALASVAPTLFANHPDQIGRFMEHSRPPCDHYERQCTIIAPCCGMPFGCRICHDDCPVLPPPKRHPPVVAVAAPMAATSPDAAASGGGGKMERRHSMPLNLDDNEFDDDQQHHRIDRFAIREVICRNCYCKQSSKT